MAAQKGKIAMSRKSELCEVRTRFITRTSEELSEIRAKAEEAKRTGLPGLLDEVCYGLMHLQDEVGFVDLSNQ